jgi:hypothetical protein
LGANLTPTAPTETAEQAGLRERSTAFSSPTPEIFD